MACEPTLSATAPPPTVRRVGGGLRPTRGARLVPTHPLLPSPPPPTARARPCLPPPSFTWALNCSSIMAVTAASSRALAAW